MSVSVVAKGDNTIAKTYWLEPTPAPAPVQAPPICSYPTYQYVPVPMAGSQWDYDMLRRADNQWVELWPPYDVVANDAVYFT
eukprot:962537-Lingulodinium_polyedra.AAC.1